MNLTLFTVSLCLLYGCSSPDAVFPEDGSHEKAYKRLSSNHLIQDVSGLPFYWDVNNVSCPSKSVDGDIITFTGGCLSKGSTITGAVTLDRSKGEDNWTIMYKDFVVGSTHWNGSVGVHTKKDKSKYVDLDFTTLSVDGNEVLTTPSLLSINATLECKTEQNCVYQEGGTGRGCPSRC